MGLFSSRDRGDKTSTKTDRDSAKSAGSAAGAKQAAETGPKPTPAPSSGSKDAASQASGAASAGSSSRAHGAQAASTNSTDGQGAADKWSARSLTGASDQKTNALETKNKNESAPSQASDAKGDRQVATLGQSIVFKGELSGDEDLEIEGQVQGDVHLANHQVTVGANGRLTAEVTAKTIVVIGHVKGNLTATERIEIQATGVVEGDLKTPRLNVSEGAVLDGSIDMSGGTAAASKPTGASAPAGSGSSEALKSA